MDPGPGVYFPWGPPALKKSWMTPKEVMDDNKNHSIINDDMKFVYKYIELYEMTINHLCQKTIIV